MSLPHCDATSKNVNALQQAGNNNNERDERKARLLALIKASRGEGIEANLRRQCAFLGIEGAGLVELQTLPPTYVDKTRLDDRPVARFAFAAGVDEAVRLAEAAENSYQYQGIYLVPNRINPAVACKAPWGQWHPQQKGQGTRDEDIEARRVVYVDFDPKREGGARDVSATPDEMHAAHKLGVRFLLDVAEVIGTVSPLGYLLSGNGVQVHVALDDIPSDEGLTERVRHFLHVVTMLYTEPGKVDVDTSVCDPRRICPAAGTMKRKGADMPEHGRRHRRTCFAWTGEQERLNLDDFTRLVEAFKARLSPEQRAQLEADGPKPPATRAPTTASPRTTNGPYRSANGVPITMVMEQLGLDPDNPTCPGCGAGGDSSVAVLEVHNRIKCLHKSCGRRAWSPLDLVAKVSFRCDDIRKDKDAAAKTLDWMADRFGTPRPGGRSRVRLVGVQDDSGQHLTDVGNAARLIARHGDDLRYVAAWDKWLSWDGRRWQTDETGEVVRRAVETVRWMREQANQEQDAARCQALLAWAHASESASRIAALVTLAKTAPGVAIRPHDLDNDGWLFNVENGTIDLRTGTRRDHDRNDLITKLAPVMHDPDAEAPRWLSFLERVQPDADVREFIQRAHGYAMTGVLREDVFLLDYGPTGSNGKTTKAKAIMRVMGDYARMVPVDMLLAKKWSSHPTELTVLFGCRMAVAAESKQSAMLDVSLVKQLTGRDRISARRMREDYWDFEPSHKLWLQTNHRPVIRETRNAIWRRVCLIPWEVTIAADEVQRDLDDVLAAEAPGILNWLIQGCLEWQALGLLPPEVVVAATAQYRLDEDSLGQFLREECIVGTAPPGNPYRVSRSRLREAYEQWCEEAGTTPMTPKALAEALRERGFVEVPSMRVGSRVVRGWEGLRVRESAEPPQDGESPVSPDDLDGCMHVVSSDSIPPGSDIFTILDSI